MTKSMQVQIRYRDFYDIPRAIVVEIDGEPYFLDCRFDSEVDDYGQFFEVFRLPRSILADLETLDWSCLAGFGERIGIIAVDHLKFDETKRKTIDTTELQTLLPGS